MASTESTTPAHSPELKRKAEAETEHTTGDNDEQLVELEEQEQQQPQLQGRTEAFALAPCLPQFADRELSAPRRKTRVNVDGISVMLNGRIHRVPSSEEIRRPRHRHRARRDANASSAPPSTALPPHTPGASVSTITSISNTPVRPAGSLIRRRPTVSFIGEVVLREESLE